MNDLKRIKQTEKTIIALTQKIDKLNTIENMLV